MKSKFSIAFFGVLMGLSGLVIAENKTAREIYEEALNKDAETIAQIYKISRADAVRRLKLQAAASEGLGLELKKEFSGRFAGMYMEHDPVDRLVVRLKGEVEVPSRKIELDGGVLLVDFVKGQSYTKNEIQKALKDNYNKLRSAIAELQGAFTDDRTGEIVLDIYLKEKDEKRLRELKILGEEILGMPVRVEWLPSELKLQAGVVRGGGNILAPECTTGFVVQTTFSSTRGVTTAGHCGYDGEPFYTDGNGNNAFLVYQEGISNATEDVQWYTVVSYPPFYTVQLEPKFYADSETIPRILTGRRKQASTKVGNNVCHHGKTTGYSCGDVAAIDYIPSSCNGQTCDATWVAVIPSQNTTPGLGCYDGDSGGPWFISTVALGIHKGGAAESEPWIGGCPRAIYMSTDRLNALGLELLYGP